MILEIGRIIANRYEIAELIGAGGMSHVYRAIDRKLHRSVTVKVLREEYIGDVNFVDRFGREARAIASLSHPNIVNVYDVGSEGDIHFIVMEYIAGKTLKQLIVNKAPFSNETMLGVASQIAAALIHAHENGIIHRDIKPQNVLCMPNGVVKVADFGIAKSHDSKNLVDEFSTMGSVHYISPEVACGDPIDPRSDLYSLGIVMFEMMTGELPFDSEDSDEVTMLHVEAPFPNIRKKNPKVLPVVREIIVRLTNKQPFRRYQSASSLYTDIQRAVMESAEEDYREDVRTETGPVRPRSLDISSSPPQRSRAPRGDVPLPRNISGRDRNRERLIIIGGIATAALLIAGLIWFVVFLLGLGGGQANGLVAVPEHIGMEVEDARAELEAIGLYLEIHDEMEYHNYIPEGHITQSTFPTGHVEPGTVVRVVISLGPLTAEGNEGMIVVPDIVGIHLDAAVIRLQDVPLSLHPEDFRSDDNLPHNYIIEQNPAAGVEVEPGTQIRIIVSMGAEMVMVPVPELIGLMDLQARSAILQAGLTLGNVIPVEHLTYGPGVVVWQSVSANTEVIAGSSIDFHVSAGILAPPDDDDEPDDPIVDVGGQEEDGGEEAGQNGGEEEDPADENGAENGENDVPDDTENNQEQGQEQPPDQQPVLITRTLPVAPIVPADRTVMLTLLQRQPDGTLRTVLMQEVVGADLPLLVQVQGIGNVEFIIHVDGVYAGSQFVLFE